MNIQKNLYGHDWLYFNRGFKIVENKKDGSDVPEISYIEVEECAFDSSFFLYSHSSNPAEVRVSLSAIIGQNGTGKSTIVDAIIRIINNLAAAIIGEDYVYSSAQHLHYIDNVYAAIAVYIDNKILILTCLGNQLFAKEYEIDFDKLTQECHNEQQVKVQEQYKPTSRIDILNGNEPVDELLPPQDGLRAFLQDWFYTLIGNYSLYAYNYRDFYSERTREVKLSKLKINRPEDNTPEDEFWLNGVFHKNDGYQTPIVIHPMRNGGYINAAKVNYLGKQNLISLAFVKSKDTGSFPFRIINNTHHLVAFYFYPLDRTKCQSAVDGIMTEKLDLNDNQKQIFRELENPIKEFWANAIGVQYSHAYDEAWNYVVYKTIKIFWNYKHYEGAWKSLENNFLNRKLELHLEELIQDSSHRTLKLRQALTYLKFCSEKNYYIKPGTVVELETISTWMETKRGIQLFPGKNCHAITIEDLLPPPYPITDVVLQLVDNEHYKEYRKEKNKSLNIIPFEGLSAGERQIAYTLGNIVYHLKNIESAMLDLNNEPKHQQSLKYNYVNIMLDEVELYFHPDLQRRFVSMLIDAIRGLKLDGIKGINVTLITHSPFVLSDIPFENILLLSRYKQDTLGKNTFAANIHDLLNNTFFLPYTIGELAKREIEDIVSLYNSLQKNLSKTNGRQNVIPNKVEEGHMTKMKYIASIVGDDYLKKEILGMIEEIEDIQEDEKD